ncbi:hypothetical protein HYPSUDRAFT_42559 [Hypholoma sublateritium FD-334 SS-4]|uniref:DUF6699 domain-containing protein n=1 Tax=Hypholoma sublateritium (strain FD-334 SS-4) TaxID=945553 RepID=A0A0D2L2L1_HYPSF|nr:hypothetical protein HYPSUDRAFT_42559 [Hypholoma sublateritium FD-334 SS-4]
MPGKHTQFVAQHASSSATPSPSSYASNLPSSAAAQTPPSPTFDSPTLSSSVEPQSPLELSFSAPRRPLSLPAIPAMLHPILAVHPVAPPVAYDLTFPPDTILPLAYAIPENFLTHQAVFPPVAVFEIHCPELPWKISVSPSAKNAQGVTVGDVFTTIYRSLRASVTEQEYALAPSDAYRNAATAMFYARVARERPAFREAERAQGLKRIDFLGKRRCFVGLVPMKNSWTLLFMRPPFPQPPPNTEGESACTLHMPYTKHKPRSMSL